ncbi:MaoC family dehydratase [Sphingomicrobium sediminis]|uniref:MaoC family dehydratase n=1 Tax=Sphingomicrobium sediminis TaxID=2950949 RepID=A0A9X2J1D7_9SPHN|nr:MaoC family dehydratase [Sphingomicrobium sediminis]
MLFLDDIEVGQVNEFGSVTTDRDEMIAFATRYDPQPFHLSDEAAAQTYFGKLAASGWHTAAMTMRVMVDWFMAHQAAGLGSPGVDNLRFLKPVYAGDKLTVTGEILSKRYSKSKPGMGSFRSRTDVHNQDGVLVMSFESEMLMLRRPSAD